MSSLQADMLGYKSMIGSEKKDLVEQIQTEFDKHKAALQGVVDASREEIGKLQTGLQSLYGGTVNAFQEVKTKVEAMERDGLPGSRPIWGAQRVQIGGTYRSKRPCPQSSRPAKKTGGGGRKTCRTSSTLSSQAWPSG